ncbi:Nuf2 family-domain-containing protein [Pelagophyceae sp. CCMP2097]|nr:Nuf2 family-domain-containing protein [Pelagophyceae sp. CCMP2097]
MYSFPLLKLAEIVDCLHELGIAVTEAELAQCDRHREAVKRVLEALTAMCSGVSRDDVARLSTLPYAELHDESVTELGLFRAAAAMLRRAGVADFSLRDWSSPTPARVRRNFSAALNFAKFREGELGVYTELCGARDEKLRVVAVSRAECAERERELCVFLGQTLGERGEIAAVEADCEALFASTAQHRGRDLAVAREMRAHAVVAANARAQHEAYDSDAAAHRAAAHRLGDGVPPSSAELRAAIDRAEAAQGAERGAISTIDRETRDLARVAEDVSRVDADVAAAVEGLADIESELAAHKAALRQLKALQQANAEARAAADDARRALDRANQGSAAADDRLRRLGDDAQREDDGTDDDGAALKNELAHIDAVASRERAATRQRAAQLRAREAEALAGAARDAADARREEEWLDEAQRALDAQILAISPTLRARPAAPPTPPTPPRLVR